MSKPSVIQTENAPQAIGPYSQAVRSGSFLFCSGQIPLDPVTQELVGGSIEEQTHRVMKNLQGVLAAAGSGFGGVLKTTVYLKNMGDFPSFNRVYESYLKPPYPARATVEVAALPKGALVEIELVACTD